MVHLKPTYYTCVCTIHLHRLSSTISNKHSMGNSNSNHSAQSVPPPNSIHNDHLCIQLNASKLSHPIPLYNNVSNSTTRNAIHEADVEEDEFEFTPIMSPPLDELSLHKNKHSLTSFPYSQALKNIATNPSASNSDINNTITYTITIIK
eukprot:391008_1